MIKTGYLNFSLLPDIRSYLNRHDLIGLEKNKNVTVTGISSTTDEIVRSMGSLTLFFFWIFGCNLFSLFIRKRDNSLTQNLNDYVLYGINHVY